MKSFYTVTALAASASASLYDYSDQNHTCTLVPDYRSCSPIAEPDLVDACCVETFGGLLLLTQYWDTYTGLEEEGQLLPENAWTIHGLWPDFCDGTWTQYCDLDRQWDPEPWPNTTTGTPNGTFVPPYEGPEIGTFLEPFGAYDLLEYMRLHFVGHTSPSWVLWAHEFAKHATCFSTFDLPCKSTQHR